VPPHIAAILITLGLLFFVGLCVVIPMYGLMALFRYPALQIRGSSGAAVRDAAELLLLLFLFGRMVSLLNEFAHGKDLLTAGLTTWLLAGVVAILVHELGHVASAKAVGFRIDFFLAGPVILQRNDVGWTLGFDLTAMRQGAAGMVGWTPVSSDNLRFNWLLATLGGPVASLLFALVILMGLLRVHGSEFERFGYRAGVCGIVSFLTSVLTLWPV
jgi:hypothetical protein